MLPLQIHEARTERFDFDHNFDQMELPIDAPRLDVPSPQPSLYFALDNHLKVLSCEQEVASLLGILSTPDANLKDSALLDYVTIERISQEVHAAFTDDRPSPRYLRIEIQNAANWTEAAFCLTIRRNHLKNGTASCHCSLEEIKPHSLNDQIFHFEHAKVLEKTGIILWSMEDEDRHFNLATQLDSLIGNPAPQTDCSFEEWISFIHVEDRKIFLEEFSRFIAGEIQKFHLRYRIIAPDEEIKWISTIATRQEASSLPKDNRILGVHKPESYIPNFNGELRLFTFLAKEIQSPIIITDPEGRITWFNNAFKHMTGYNSEELIGRKPGDFLQGNLSDSEVVSYMRDRIKQKKAFHAELINYNKSGSPYFVKIDANPLIDDYGKVTHFIAFQTDISENKKNQKRISRNESKFRSLFDNSLDALLLVSKQDGRIIEANRAARKRFQENRLEGKIITDLCREKSGFAAEDMRSLLKKSQDGWQQDCEFKQSDGTNFPVELSLCRIPMRDSEAFLMTLRDISEKRLLEEQLRRSQKMEAVGKLAGGVAHDFNNLLAGMRGFSELLSNSEYPSTRDRVYINELLKITERARDLTSRLLSFSRGQSSKPAVANLNRIIDSFSPMLSRMIKEDIQFTTQLKENIPNSLLDVTQVEQVILNLVVNAQEATSGKDKSIRLRSDEISLTGKERFITGNPTPGKYVSLEVEDNGHGIAAETLEKIFEPFFTTKEGAGTGLGLSIVYGIVDKNNGHLDVQSTPGKGTIFQVVFPVVDQEIQPEKRQDRIAPLPTAKSKGKATILIAEDQAQVREILELGLSQTGYQLLIAKDGEEAVELAKSHNGHIDLLLTDAIMPKMHGCLLATEVRKLFPELRVVVMSGLPESETISEDEEKVEIDAYVDKPFSIRKLVELINGILEKKSASVA